MSRLLIVARNSKVSIENPQILFLHTAHERWLRSKLSLYSVGPFLETLAKSCCDVIVPGLVEREIL